MEKQTNKNPNTSPSLYTQTGRTFSVASATVSSSAAGSLFPDFDDFADVIGDMEAQQTKPSDQNTERIAAIEKQLQQHQIMFQQMSEIIGKQNKVIADSNRRTKVMLDAVEKLSATVAAMDANQPSLGRRNEQLVVYPASTDRAPAQNKHQTRVTVDIMRQGITGAYNEMCLLSTKYNQISPMYTYDRRGLAHAPEWRATFTWLGESRTGEWTAIRKDADRGAVSRWVRDLTVDGNVELNPGPQSIVFDSTDLGTVGGTTDFAVVTDTLPKLLIQDEDDDVLISHVRVSIAVYDATSATVTQGTQGYFAITTGTIESLNYDDLLANEPEHVVSADSFVCDMVPNVVKDVDEVGGLPLYNNFIDGTGTNHINPITTGYFTSCTKTFDFDVDVAVAANTPVSFNLGLSQYSATTYAVLFTVTLTYEAEVAIPLSDSLTTDDAIDAQGRLWFQGLYKVDLKNTNTFTHSTLPASVTHQSIYISLLEPQKVGVPVWIGWEDDQNVVPNTVESYISEKSSKQGWLTLVSGTEPTKVVDENRPYAISPGVSSLKMCPSTEDSILALVLIKLFTVAKNPGPEDNGYTPHVTVVPTTTEGPRPKKLIGATAPIKPQLTPAPPTEKLNTPSFRYRNKPPRRMPKAPLDPQEYGATLSLLDPTPEEMLALMSSKKSSSSTTTIRPEPLQPVAPVVVSPAVLDEVARLKTVLTRDGRYKLERLAIAAFGGLMENIFLILPGDEMTSDSPVEPNPGNNVDMTRKSTTRPPGPTPGEKKTKPDVSGGANDRPTRTPEEQLKQERDVLARFKARHEKEPMCTMRWMHTMTPGRKWVERVAQTIWGASWEESESMDMVQLYAYCYVHMIPTQVLVARLVDFVPELVAYRGTMQPQEWIELFKSALSIDLSPDAGYGEHEQRVRNQKMHATNGNVKFTTNMDEVDAASSTDAMFTDEPSLATHIFQEQAVMTLLTNITATHNPALTSTASDLGFSASIVTAANAITNLAMQTLPNTNWIPREVRPAAGGAPIPAAQRLPYKAIGIGEYAAVDLLDLPSSNRYLEAAQRATETLARKDNTSAQGFSAIDIGFEAGIKAQRGLSLDAWLLKLVILHTWASWERPTRNLPMSELSQIDYNSQPVDQAAFGATMTDTQSPVYNEACGADPVDADSNPVFPYSGAVGTIAWHLTPVSVPDGQQYYYVPASLLLGSNSPQQLIFLLAYMIAEAPCAFLNALVHTLDNGGANAATQIFTFLPSVARIPGDLTIHLILPRQPTVTNPTTQLQAQARARFLPMSGPQATANTPANTVYDVCFVGAGGLNQYALSEFLYSWLDTVWPQTVIDLLNQIQAFCDISGSLEYVREFMCSHLAGMPTMAVAQNVAGGTEVPFAVNTSEQFQVSDVFARIWQLSVADWPLNNVVPQASAAITQTDWIAWNRVMLKLSMAPNMPPVLATKMPNWLVNYNNAAYIGVHTVALAAMWQSYLDVLGMDQSTWSTAYALTNLTAAPDLVKSHNTMARLSATGMAPLHPKAQQSPTLRAYMKAFLGCRPSYTQDGQNDDVSIFDTLFPNPVPWAVSYYYNGAAYVQMAGLSPHTVADTWIRFFAQSLPKYQNAYPPPFGTKSTMGYSDGDMRQILLGANLQGPNIDAAAMIPAVPTNNIRDDSDNSRWNQKLAYYFANAAPTFWSGAALADVPPAGYFPVQRKILYNAAYLAAFNQPDARWRLTETCRALQDENGYTIFPLTTAVNITSVQRACQRIITLNASAWLFNNLSALPSVPNADTTINKAKWFMRVKPPDVPKGGLLKNAIEQSKNGDSNSLTPTELVTGP